MAKSKLKKQSDSSRELIMNITLPLDSVKILQDRANEERRTRKQYIEYILIEHAKELISEVSN